jgi:hypothetical protein
MYSVKYGKTVVTLYLIDKRLNMADCLTLKMKILKSFEMSVISLKDTASQTGRLYCSTTLLRLWHSHDVFS